jgi:hypothetical protein
MGESKHLRFCMGLLVVASILITSCEGPEEEEEEEESGLPAWCNVRQSHYTQGVRVCLDGALQECQADGRWTKIEKDCKSLEHPRNLNSN